MKCKRRRCSLDCKGEYALIAIHFEQVHDCKQLFSQLRAYIQKYATYGLGGAVKVEGDDTILLNYEHSHVNFYDSFHPLLASVLTDYVISTKEDDWLLDIIESMFYFTDEEEQQQILTIARAILEGDRNDLPSLSDFFNRRAFIYDAFANHLEEETTFYYEPFLTFRLRDYGEMLIDCVEIAIDEYMLEQEYQNMIENFRQYLKYKPVKLELVHVVHDDTFSFYDEHFRRMTREEILFHLKMSLSLSTRSILKIWSLVRLSAWLLVLFMCSRIIQIMASFFRYKPFFKNG